MAETIAVQKFSLGAQVATPGALAVLDADGHHPGEFLRRHASGDWGELDAEDVRENNYSLKHGFRLLSAYHTRSGRKFWIITEADRASTTILLPEEY